MLSYRYLISASHVLRPVIAKEVRRFEDRTALNVEVNVHGRVAGTRCHIFARRGDLVVLRDEVGFELRRRAICD